MSYVKISVFITSFNQHEYLRQAIDSVLAQSLSPHQIVVVDDASSDGSQELIAHYASRHGSLFFPIYHDVNRGVAQTRVDALNAVSGDFVTYVDGDDWFLPDKLKKESAALLANPSADIVYSSVDYMNEDGSKSLYTWTDNSPFPQGDIFLPTFTRDFPYRDLFRMELVNFHAWKELGFHDSRLDVFEDFDMRIRLTKRLKATCVSEVLSRVRTHKEGLSKMDVYRRFQALDYIFRKNLVLLDDLSDEQRRRGKQALAAWIYVRGRRALLRALLYGRLGQMSHLFTRVLYYWRLSCE